MAHHRPLRNILFRLVLLPTLILGSVSGLIPANASVPIISRVLSPLAASPAVAASLTAPATCGTGDPGLVAGACTVTVNVVGYDQSNPSGPGLSLDSFTYIINVDNTKLPSDPQALSNESNSPIVRTGDQSRTQVTLPDGRYLVSARSLDHKMWGAYFTLPGDADTTGCPDGCLTVRIDLTEQSADHPLPLGKIRVFVFNDNAWTNGAPDTEEAGLNGFKAELVEQTDSAVTVDYNNDPLCGGACITGTATGTEGPEQGFVTIDNLGPASYFIDVHPPESCDPNDPNATSGPGQWYQTTTIDGGLSLLAPTEEGADGTGAPGEQLWEPPTIRTAYWFGFVCSPHPFANPGTGVIVGTARNWVEWAPYTTGTFNDPVENPFVALSDSTTDVTVYIGQGDAAGNFDIQNVPPGSYNLAIWDEQLSYIMRFKPITIAADETVDVNDTGDDGSVGVGVSRWFGWLDGYVYKDLNNNGMMDVGEPTLGNTDVDQRWRDGSIKESTFTDPSGYYQYPTAEGGALGRWIVTEQGFARFSSYPGPSVHNEHTGAVIPSCDATPVANPCIPVNQGGGLLTNQLLLEGHRATVDWGKRDYAPGTPGQIVGITYFATTRNEFNAALQAHEDYEAAIPDVTVYLETLGLDGQPNTADDVIVNAYVTDHWQQPNASQDPQPDGNTFTQNCNPIMDFNGLNITSMFNPNIGPNCLEVPLMGLQTKDGAFDGGFAFADYCPNGFDENASDPDNAPCWGEAAHTTHVATVPLIAGTYITHVIMPKDPTDTRDCNTVVVAGDLNATTAKGSIPGGGTGCIYRIVKEEDVNVDLGNNFTPAIPPPPCVGDDHVLDQSTLVMRSPLYTGNQGTSPSAPLCDKHLVVLTNGQNANADFNMMTNFRTDPNGDGTSNVTGDVAEPARFVGQVFNDIYFERNPLSPWYGEPRPIGGIPVGIYARVDTVPNNVNLPYSPDHWRLLTTVTTSPDGSFEVLVPSTETLNCPIPQGPCPGMYLITVDDPGSIDHPNRNYNPNLLIATTPADAWPGLTDPNLDLPVDPISGTACEDPAAETGPARPELLQVSTPVVPATGSRQIVINGDFIGTPGPANATGGRITLTDARTGAVTTLTRAAGGGITSWTVGTSGINGVPDTITITVPAINTTTFRPGPKQLTIITANANGAVPSVNGITIHVLGSNGSGSSLVTYTPTVVNVLPPPPTTGPNGGPHAIQNAIDSAAPGSLLVLSPGTYNENLLLWKPLKIQGLGPGGIIGAHEFGARDPEDPRFNVPGSVIDGRFFAQNNATAFDATVAAHAPYAVDPDLPDILRGADITVVDSTPDTVTYDISGPTGIFNAARIDGLGLMTGQGNGAGGIQLQANINNMQITNDVLENNGGIFAGGIGIGQPYAHANHNYNVRIANDRLIGNGGLTRSGGIGIFYGSNNYEVANSIVCSNFGVEYGAGISHWGLSPNGSIHDNQIYYNEVFDSGAGISIQTELPSGTACAANPTSIADCLGLGSGAVDIDRNLIQSNYTGDDGGGIFVLDAFDAPINIRNNMIVDNGASDLGGAIMLDDSSNVRIINNTVANNVSTASSENSDGNPHGAGLTSEANDPLFQTMLGAARTDTASTNNGTLVLDSAIVAGDVGRTVTAGAGGIPGGTTILSVTPGVSFVMSNAATQTGTRTLTITRSASVTIATGSNVAFTPSAVAADLNRSVTFAPAGNNLGGTRTITAVNPGVSFTFSGGAKTAGGSATRTATITKTDAGATINDGTLVLDPATVASDLGKNVSGPGIPAGAMILSVNPGASFVMSLKATATATVALTIAAADFSNPVALFNNIFWNNNAFTLSQPGPGATLVDNGFIDFEIYGTTNTADTFTPRYSDLTNGLILGPGMPGAQNPVPGGQGNIIGADPLFVTPFILELTVSGSRLDPQVAAVTITGADPPVGITGNYHISLPTGLIARLVAAFASSVIDRGVRCSNIPFPTPASEATASQTAACTGGGIHAPPVDYDGQTRPIILTGRLGTRWDLGADESTLLP
jgi:hypothetical protein